MLQNKLRSSNTGNIFAQPAAQHCCIGSCRALLLVLLRSQLVTQQISMLQIVATCCASSPGVCCHSFVARFLSCYWWSLFFQDLGSKDINADAYLVAHIVRIGGSHKIINCTQIILWTREEELLCDNTEEPSCNEPLYNDTSVNRTIFFTSVIVSLMETTLVIVNICQSLGPTL